MCPGQDRGYSVLASLLKEYPFGLLVLDPPGL